MMNSLDNGLLRPFKPYPAYRPSGVEWLDETPAHWEVTAVKHHYSVQLGKMLQNNPNNADDVEVPYLKALHVQWFDVQTKNPPPMWANQREINLFGIRKGDLLVCEGGEGGRSGVVEADVDGYIIQNALHRVRPSKDSRNDFLQYVLGAIMAVGWFDALNEKATIAHFTGEKFGALRIPLPPLFEQCAIAAFLDRETERIDTLVSKKERLIGLLQEKRTALITRTVTLGLDPNAAMKDSGVEWLGEIPAHWEVKRLKEIGMALIGLTYSTGDVVVGQNDGSLVLRASNISEGKIVLEDNVYVGCAVPEKLITRVGDILICSRSGSRGLIGKNAIIDSDSSGVTFGTFMTIYRSPHNDYLHYVFNSALFEFQSGMFITSTINQLTLGMLNGFRVPLPPDTEQRAIAAFLDQETAKLDSLIAKVREAVDRLKELRTALISAAVTGRIDVREEAG